MLRTTIMATEDTVLLFDAGAGTAQGERNSQEDRYVVILPDEFPPSQTTDKFALLATYDGHGSSMVSEHVRQNLAHLLVSRPEFSQGDYETAICRAFEDEDSLLFGLSMAEDIEPVISGTTVALCLVNLTKGLVVVGNVGDSHILLAERDPLTEAIVWQDRLTKAHKPNTPAERNRIERAGGAVRVISGTARLGSLNMSRALGDLQYKNPINTLDIDATSKSRRVSTAIPQRRGDFLSNKPHVRTVKLDKNSRYALLCSTDGVSDTTDDKILMEEVVAALTKGQRASDIAKSVTSMAAGMPGSDNCTCVVAFFDGIQS
ncbi:phosphatase 2C-like domain-containing protein [Talaromyces proteolyticus]|uniref:protein-serine/threonine phosphatase n=1 Tax=Talaromyces proteolyticus TaxID=1131652 RepID=A0AAD4PXV8_9EURO|nr:phosphatase 2C-like domain-containing protein [Talaromyces proteolyticus]KAH8693759.1 phosphatase 2C-like domain-containing protein [Talaromyces proteolyticus]